jgi:hypothetical protein
MKLGQAAQDRITAFVADAAKQGFAGLQKVGRDVKADAAVDAGDVRAIVSDGSLYVQHSGAVYEVGALSTVLPELSGATLFEQAKSGKQFVAGETSSTLTRGRGLQTTHTLAQKLPQRETKPLTVAERRELARANFATGVDALVKKIGAQHTGGLAPGAQQFWVDVAKTGSIGFESIPEAARDNLAVVAAWLKQSPSDRTFKAVGANLRDNEELAKLLLALDGDALEHASERLRGKKEVVLVAVGESGESALQHASKALRGDIDVATAAVRNTPYAYRFVEAPAKDDKALIREFAVGSWSFADKVSKATLAELRQDKQFVLDHVRQHPRAVRDLFKEWHGDDDVMRVAVQGDAEMLKFASERLKTDVEVVKAAVAQNGRAYDFVDAGVAAREDVMLAAMGGKEGWTAVHRMMDNPEAAKRFADRAFVMKAIPLEERAFWMAEAFHGDRDLVMHAMNHFGGLSFAKAFQADPEIAAAAVAKNPREMKNVSTKAPNYDELARQALKTDPHLLWSLPKRFGKDRAIVEDVVQKDAALLNHVDPKLVRDPAIIKLTADGSNVHASVFVEHCKGNREAVLALAQSKTFFEYYAGEAGSLLKGFSGDRDIMLGAIRQNPALFEKAGAKLKRDPAFVMAAVQANGNALRYVGAELQSKREVVMAALTGDSLRVNDFGSKLDLSRWLGDRDFARELLAANGARLRDLPPQLRGDRELVALACQQAWRNIVFASDALRTDATFVAGLTPKADA